MKKLLIVCSEPERKYANYLQQLISAFDDTDNGQVGLKDGTVEAVVWDEKDYEKNRVTLSSKGHVLFVGNGKIAKAARSTMEEKFNVAGIHYGWLGTQGFLYAEPSEMNRDNYQEFLELCDTYGQSFEKKLELSYSPSEQEALMKTPDGLFDIVRVTNAIQGATTAVSQVLAKGSDKLQSQETHNQQYTVATLLLYMKDLESFMGL